MDNLQLGLAIKSAREAAKLTQDDLSDRAGLAYSTLAKIEQGAIKNPSFSTILALSRALNLSIEQLLGAKPANVRVKTVPTAVKFIYCDVNGVMVRFYHHAFVSLSEETGVPLDKVESTFWHYNDACNRGEITLEGFNKSMAHHLGVKRVDWRRHYMGSVQPIKETHEFLARAETKYKIGLLTNIMPGFLAEMFGLGVLPQLNFSAIVDSTKVGAVKPEDKIYLKAEAMAGCKGQEIFFIDDSRANLTEAERFNWRVFWFDDFDPAESVRRIEQTLER